MSGGERSGERAAEERVADLELSARLAAGEHAALTEAYERFGGMVFGLARRVVHDVARAEEVTQEVFIYLWEHPARFDPARGSMRTWLGLLAHSRGVDCVRSETRRTQREARLGPMEAVTAPQPEVDAELSRSWIASTVREALDQLPPEQRDAVVLAYFGGRTYRQVAAELAIPEGTAKSRLRLALATLADVLRPILHDEDAPAWT